MSNNAPLSRRGSPSCLVFAFVLLLSGGVVLSQEVTLDLREGSPIFRRGSSRRPVAANATNQAAPTMASTAPVSSSSIRRSSPQPQQQQGQQQLQQQPYASAPTAETDAGVSSTASYGSSATGESTVASGIVEEAAAAPLSGPGGKARRSNPDVSPLLPLPNWENGDVPTQAPSSLGQGRMIGESPSGNYVLNASDYVRILVYQEPDLATETRISKDGSINFPLLGMTQIGGKTVNEAVELIRKKLDNDFLVNPQITLTVLEYSRARFTILGEVNHPGTYDIPREEIVTLLDAVASAGGFTRTARTTSVTVKRKSDGRENVIKIDAKQMARESTASFNILPGDTITVPTTIF